MSNIRKAVRYGRRSIDNGEDSNTYEKQDYVTRQLAERVLSKYSFSVSDQFHFDNNISGTTKCLKRPAFNQAFQELNRGDVLVVCEAARLSRNAFDSDTTIELLHKEGCDVIWPGRNYNHEHKWRSKRERTLHKLFTVADELGPAETSDRQTINNAFRRDVLRQPSSGNACNSPPFGYRFTHKVNNSGLDTVRNKISSVTYIYNKYERERRDITEFAQMAAAGYSCKAIAQKTRLESSRWTTRLWHEKSVRNAIKARYLHYPLPHYKRWSRLPSIAEAIREFC